MNLAVCNANTSHHTTHDRIKVKYRGGFQSRFSRNVYFTDTSVCDVADDVIYLTSASCALLSPALVCNL